MRAQATRIWRRIIWRLNLGILRSSSGMLNRGCRLMNLVVRGREAFFSASGKGLMPTTTEMNGRGESNAEDEALAQVADQYVASEALGRRGETRGNPFLLITPSCLSEA